MSRMVPLSHGFETVVDDADYERVIAAGPWNANRKPHTTYAQKIVSRADGVRTTVLLHCFILGQTGVDHRNGNGLDNRRTNLRPASTQQNAWNRGPLPGSSSRFKGVTWYKRHERWQAQIKVDGKNRSLGYFDDEEDAARAYDAAAAESFGDFARLNFHPNGDQQ